MKAISDSEFPLCVFGLANLNPKVLKVPPTIPQSLTITKTTGKPGHVCYTLQLNTIPPQPITPGPVLSLGELLIKIHTAALNHRDFFIRQHLYPGISFTLPLLCDGCGTVVQLGKSDAHGRERSGSSPSLLGKRVLVNPVPGHSSGVDRPLCGEGRALPRASLVSPIEGAALPLAGLTGWRALVTKRGNAKAGRKVLVTGVGGGVALQVLDFGVAMGGNVYVTSGCEEKIEKAVELGARGGVNYTGGVLGAGVACASAAFEAVP
ncbi:MDR/zinc-dependent alcohol dehydrogenase-like family protein [Aspergillus lucknowensis]|uniref:Alcohol dehydrogenase-like N-terminal domain-containing protein n=1 Tax=Aspergillus lucknowensis TaxID=176173 RepID=A0ABR4LGR3_9EURO